MSKTPMNTLYYGDNLKILRDYIKDESVDLIYLDPPFNSNRNYNVLFKNESGAEAESQITAFEDTWHWNIAAEATYKELIGEPGQVGRMIESFRQFIGDNQMMAYLVMMAVRLKELHRVLKPTGSLYLHCDPTASHYLKILLDTVFGATNFRNEITWKRKTGRGETQHKSNRFGVMTDILLFYSKTDRSTFNSQFNPDAPGYQEYVKGFFTHVDEHGRKYATDNLGSPSFRENLFYEYKGYKPPPTGWAISREKMEAWDKEGRLHLPEDKNGRIRRKRYEDELQGRPVQNLWDDIDMIPSQAAERLGYPTQKPVALLERIISASSNEGDVVLDPFCGCGTTIAAAQELNREWIGIDVTHLSVGLQKLRLLNSFKMVPGKDYKVVGQPEDLEGAKELAEKDKYGFQWWILPLIGAKAFGSETGKKEGKKGADGGIDGELVFSDDNSGKAKRVMVSVKGGHNVSVAQIRDLGHVIDRENAAIGVFVTLEPPTGPMRKEADGKGFYHSPGWNKDYPRLQILTVEQILAGKQIELPPNIDTFKKAQKMVADSEDQQGLF